ncbi:(Fe-S)-binding protein [Paenibacillus athensensis]|uniref:4Fe-4S ferredoxin-type domain-containing protein n=1 Tax=Paenibacillus athensensis TaxID=1967502 RepID=A0A4Y8QBZ9_9BACL|nr:(Fe-S)-binding protein [Paenibacillus athensensis]MCD1257506.1 (Fe-S)-binding protein [Paenibacillus athensensis]
MSAALMQFVLFLLVTGYAVFLFARIVQRRFANVRLGRPVERKRKAAQGWRTLLVEGLGQSRLLHDPKSGVMHIVLLYGFLIVQLGALDLLAKGLTGRGLPLPGYEVFGLIQELTAVLIIAAAAYAGYRRYIEKLARLKRGWKPSIVLFFIVLLMLSVLFALAFARLEEVRPASGLAPVSSLLAAALGDWPQAAAHTGFEIAWWAHLLVLLSFLVYVPQSKHFHILTAPINLWLGRTDPPGKLSKLDLETEEVESFGAARIEHFTQKQLLDLYACVECGRCTSVCPANATGKLLSPMHLIIKLRDHLTAVGEEQAARRPSAQAWVVEDGDRPEVSVKGAEPEERPPLAGGIISEEELWACTTCRNCEEMCPVGNEHVDKIVDLRRYLVLTEGSMPAEAQRALQNIERQGNPWGLSRSARADWQLELEPYGELRVPTVRENPDFDVLLFVGSMGSYDRRSRKITLALVRLLREAGVNFATLGNEEKNSGDTARRMGNEFLFQQLCADNIAMFERYGVRTIVTACPHTLHTMRNEYPDFGLTAEVLHHSELLARLVAEGKLRPQHPLDERIVYHDSCYLGRYNGMYDPPRAILQAIPGVRQVEQPRSREHSMCCGAGGGLMWMEERSGVRVNEARTAQLLTAEPTLIGSACPYCLTMLEDGTRQAGGDTAIPVRDIAELLALSVWGPDKTGG